MELNEYWAIVEAARAASTEASEVAERVGAELATRSAEFVYQFHQTQRELLRGAYGWPLWGAAYLINGGCSDDGFEYFRAWLLTQGREAFERALAEPDSLADLIEPGEEVEDEDMLSVASNAYKAITGSYPRGPVMKLPELGDSWDFDDQDEMQRRYPRCWAKVND